MKGLSGRIGSVSFSRPKERGILADRNRSQVCARENGFSSDAVNDDGGLEKISRESKAKNKKKASSR